MKTLTEKDLVELLPAYSDQAEAAVARLADTLAAFDSVEAFSYAVKEGFLQCTNVEVNGEPAYIIFYNVDRLRSAISFAVVALAAVNNFPAIVDAFEQLARLHHCRWMHFNTRRAGIVKQFARFNYIADTVNMVKELR